MKTHPYRFWTIVILLGWAFDFLFWEKPPGINFAIFVILCLVTGITLLRSEGLQLSPRAGLLLLPIALLAAMTFMRQDPLTVFLSVAMVLFLMGVLALSYGNGKWIHYRVLDYVFGYLRLFGSVLLRPLELISRNRRQAASTHETRRTRVWPFIRGVVIALPVVAIFAALLSSADPIFAERFEGLIELFNIENLTEYVFRLAYILITAYALAGTFLHAAETSSQELEQKSWFSPFLGFTEAAIVLSSVVMLFIAFVVIQFQYFFGGQTNIGVEGYTYSEYARKGFGELVTVAFFSLLLLLGLGAITRRDTDNQRRLFSILGTGLVSLLIVIMIAAFQWLTLYEAAYGFSRLRTYTHVFMIWLGLLLVAVVVLEGLRRGRLVGLVMVVTALGFIISLNVLNVDAFIVRQNIQREIRSTSDEAFARGRADLDAQYFLDLSDDAIPPLVDAYLSNGLPASVKDKVGAALTCKNHERHEQDEEGIPWQGFHFSRWRADAAFQQVEDRLGTYEIIEKDWPVLVETPGGAEFPCVPYYFD